MRKVTVKEIQKSASLGERIAYLRTSKGLKQEDIATKLIKDRTLINRFESGDRAPDIQTIIELAKLFDVSTDYLLGLNDIESSNINNIEINKLTGLSNKAIGNLTKLNEDSKNNAYYSSRQRIINALLEALNGSSDLISAISSFSVTPSQDNEFYINYKKEKDKRNYENLKDLHYDTDYNIPLWKLLREIESFVNPIKRSKETADSYEEYLKCMEAFVMGFTGAIDQNKSGDN